MMEEFHAKLYEVRGQKVVAALKKNGFDALYVPSAELAVDKVLGFVYPSAKVGFGGSATIKSMNIQERAASKGAIVLDHNKPGLGSEEKWKFCAPSSPATSLYPARMQSRWKGISLMSRQADNRVARSASAEEERGGCGHQQGRQKSRRGLRTDEGLCSAPQQHQASETEPLRELGILRRLRVPHEDLQNLSHTQA